MSISHRILKRPLDNGEMEYEISFNPDDYPYGKYIKVKLENYNPSNPDAVIGIDMIFGRKNKGENWDCANNTILTKGQAVRIKLNRKESRFLFETLKAEYEKVAPTEIAEKRTRELVDYLKDNSSMQVLLEALEIESPDSFDELNHFFEFRKRKSTISKFEEMLSNPTLSESDWQKFFNENKWLLGLGMMHQYIDLTTAQAIVSNPNHDKSSSSIVDFSGNSIAERKFAVIVEIKKPNTKLMSDVEFRNNVYSPSEELMNSVSQIQYYSDKMISRKFNDEEVIKDHENRISRSGLRSVLIIGNTNKLEKQQHSCFEIFRSSLNNITILTFDEIKHRLTKVLAELESSGGS